MSDSPISSSPASTSDRETSRGHVVAREGQPWLLPLITQLHFYIGLFVGPLLLVAALSGIVYALTPQLEDIIYRDALYTDRSGPAMPLSEQIAIAQKVMGPQARVEAIRPAPEPGTTTRVMFGDDTLGPSEHHAVFIDPVSGEVRASLNVYGTSGVLPLRSVLDRFHRGLLLGDFGRLYSELAASWLWILAVGGLVLWWRRRLRGGTSSIATSPQIPHPHRLRRWHGTLGACAFLGVLFFSITGLTWSQYAGSNIGVLRAHYGWGTPSVSTDLPATTQDSFAAGTMRDALSRTPDPGSQGDEHAHHHAADAEASAQAAASVNLAMFDDVLNVARVAGIEAGKVEIRPPATDGKAWTVTEIDRSWPTQVDAVSIDPRNMSVVDQTDFATFPLAAKLTRWGIDAHMGALFGLPNQLLLVGMATCLTVMVIWGYMMWWRRRPTRMRGAGSPPGTLQLLRRASWPGLVCLLAIAIALGFFLPVMGISLVGFLALDCILQWRHRNTYAGS